MITTSTGEANSFARSRMSSFDGSRLPTFHKFLFQESDGATSRPVPSSGSASKSVQNLQDLTDYMPSAGSASTVIEVCVNTC
jgi:hypothetical protein